MAKVVSEESSQSASNENQRILVKHATEFNYLQNYI